MPRAELGFPSPISGTGRSRIAGGTGVGSASYKNEDPGTGKASLLLQDHIAENSYLSCEVYTCRPPRSYLQMMVMMLTMVRSTVSIVCITLS